MDHHDVRPLPRPPGRAHDPTNRGVRRAWATRITLLALVCVGVAGPAGAGEPSLGLRGQRDVLTRALSEVFEAPLERVAADLDAGIRAVESGAIRLFLDPEGALVVVGREATCVAGTDGLRCGKDAPKDMTALRPYTGGAIPALLPPQAFEPDYARAGQSPDSSGSLARQDCLEGNYPAQLPAHLPAGAYFSCRDARSDSVLGQVRAGGAGGTAGLGFTGLVVAFVRGFFGEAAVVAYAGAHAVPVVAAVTIVTVGATAAGVLAWIEFGPGCPGCDGPDYTSHYVGSSDICVSIVDLCDHVGMLAATGSQLAPPGGAGLGLEPHTTREAGFGGSGFGGGLGGSDSVEGCSEWIDLSDNESACAQACPEGEPSVCEICADSDAIACVYVQ